MPDSPTALPVPSKPPGTPGQKALALGSRYGLRLVALGYLAVILAAPLALVFWNAFDDGFGAAWDAITTPAALHALKLTRDHHGHRGSRSTRSSAWWRP